MVRFGIASALLIAGCSFTPGGSIDATTACVERCEGATMWTCPQGTQGAPEATTCPQGCVAEPTLHCGMYRPANVSDPDLATARSATGGITFSSTPVTLNSDIPGFVDSATRDPVTFPGVQLIAVNSTTLIIGVTSLNVPAGTTWYGQGKRAVIVVATGDIDVQGTIDFTPGCFLDGMLNNPRCGGPGGGNGGKRSGAAAAGCGFGQGGSASTGGAGGGFATQGGNGGNGGSDALASNLSACEPSADLEPLIGGSGGGAGNGSEGSGGGGGGGIQLSAYGSVRIAGSGTDAIIDVGGGGGFGAGDNSGGGGGGSGGAIYIDAPNVTISAARLLAAGGGGGAGRGGADGEFANRDAVTAAAGGNGNGGGNGGVGAIGTGTGGPGTAASGGGGGGGGMGRIRINTTAGGFAFGASVKHQGVYAAGQTHRD